MNLFISGFLSIPVVEELGLSFRCVVLSLSNSLNRFIFWLSNLNNSLHSFFIYLNENLRCINYFS